MHRRGQDEAQKGISEPLQKGRLPFFFIIAKKEKEGIARDLLKTSPNALFSMASLSYTIKNLEVPSELSKSDKAEQGNKKPDSQPNYEDSEYIEPKPYFYHFGQTYHAGTVDDSVGWSGYWEHESKATSDCTPENRWKGID